MRRASWIQTAAVAAGLLPLAALLAAALGDRLGANPIETITHTTGDWALRWLLVCLAVTPVRRWLGWSWAAPLRRTFGLLAFGYACLHFGTWIALDLGLDLEAALEDVVERRYVTLGMTAFALLLPLAATSTRGMVRRLGGRRWGALHRLVYPAAIAACAHYLWLAKADLAPPLAHAGVLALLLGLRLRPPRARRERRG